MIRNKWGMIDFVAKLPAFCGIVYLAVFSDSVTVYDSECGKVSAGNCAQLPQPGISVRVLQLPCNIVFFARKQILIQARPD